MKDKLGWPDRIVQPRTTAFNQGPGRVRQGRGGTCSKRMLWMIRSCDSRADHQSRATKLSFTSLALSFLPAVAPVSPDLLYVKYNASVPQTFLALTEFQTNPHRGVLQFWQQFKNDGWVITSASPSQRAGSWPFPPGRWLHTPTCNLLGKHTVEKSQRNATSKVPRIQLKIIFHEKM